MLLFACIDSLFFVVFLVIFIAYNVHTYKDRADVIEDHSTIRYAGVNEATPIRRKRREEGREFEL